MDYATYCRDARFALNCKLHLRTVKSRHENQDRTLHPDFIEINDHQELELWCPLCQYYILLNGNIHEEAVWEFDLEFPIADPPPLDITHPRFDTYLEMILEYHYQSYHQACSICKTSIVTLQETSPDPVFFCPTCFRTEFFKVFVLELQDFFTGGDLTLDQNRSLYNELNPDLMLGPQMWTTRFEQDDDELFWFVSKFSLQIYDDLKARLTHLLDPFTNEELAEIFLEQDACMQTIKLTAIDRLMRILHDNPRIDPHAVNALLRRYLGIRQSRQLDTIQNERFDTIF